MNTFIANAYLYKTIFTSYFYSLPVPMNKYNRNKADDTNRIDVTTLWNVNIRRVF